MSKLRMQIAISVDGYAAGPNPSEKDPLGEGGMALHQWAFELDAWNAQHGREKGERNASSEVVEGFTENIGAAIMGRNMFGGGPGPWPEDPPWNGWWGDDPPFPHPVFVLTHHEREPLTLGQTIFHFVTDGIETALDQAREAAGEGDVSLGGGAEVCREYIAAGLVDEMTLNVAPLILGGGERLFDGFASPREIELIGAVDAPGVTHLKYRFA